MKATDKFLSALPDWENELQKDEWFFCKLREEILERLSPEFAYSQISEVLELVLDQEDEFLFSESLELALGLIRKADTTEIPKGLEQQLAYLLFRTSNMGKNEEYIKRQIQEIQRWFRIDTI